MSEQELSKMRYRPVKGQAPPEWKDGLAQEDVLRLITETVCRAIRAKGAGSSLTAGGRKVESSLMADGCKAESDGGAPDKPGHMTHLRGDTLVYKDHPRIAFRGAIDSLESEILLVQIKAGERRQRKLYEDLDEIIAVIRRLLRCEVSGEAVGEVRLQNLSTDELRAHSHHPSQYYGIRHFLPTAEHGEMVVSLNRLRTKARETELAAYRAFREESGEVSREDILRVLNRLSSLFWIMMFKYLTGVYEADGLVEMEASGRHVHLSRQDAEALFGVGYRLTRVRDLSQPGQYVCKERVNVTGPKGTIQNVVVLGPERKETQVEVSFTDGLTLGLKPPVRLSGDIKDSPGAVLSYEGRQLAIDRGVIVAKRHMHVAAADAGRLQVKDKDVVSIEALGTRPVIFKDTVVRVSEEYATYVHIDYDEANACGFEKGMYCKIVR